MLETFFIYFLTSTGTEVSLLKSEACGFVSQQSRTVSWTRPYLAPWTASLTSVSGAWHLFVQKEVCMLFLLMMVLKWFWNKWISNSWLSSESFFFTRPEKQLSQFLNQWSPSWSHYCFKCFICHTLNIFLHCAVKRLVALPSNVL